MIQRIYLPILPVEAHGSPVLDQVAKYLEKHVLAELEKYSHKNYEKETIDNKISDIDNLLDQIVLIFYLMETPKHNFISKLVRERDGVKITTREVYWKDQKERKYRERQFTNQHAKIYNSLVTEIILSYQETIYMFIKEHFFIEKLMYEKGHNFKHIRFSKVSKLRFEEIFKAWAKKFGTSRFLI